MLSRNLSKRAGSITLVAAFLIHCGGKADNQPVAPVAPVVASLTLSPCPMTLAPSDTVQLLATTRAASGAVLTGYKVSLNSTNPTVATVTGAGIVTAVDTGAATITASVNGISVECHVTVAQLARQLMFAPAFNVVNAGDSAQLTVQYKEKGIIQLVTAPLTWSSSAPADLAVNQSGHVVADVSSGTVTITVSLDTLSAVATVKIQPVVKPLASIIYDRGEDINTAQPYSPVRTVYIDGTVNVRITLPNQPILAWDPSPDGKSIAVMYGSTSFNGGAYYGKIGGFAVNLATRVETPLTHTMDTPKWSPDGKKIAFTVVTTGTDADLYVINADGTGVQQLTSQPGLAEQPTWSPDSRAIAFARVTLGPVNTGALWVINVDGTGQRQIPVQSSIVTEPVWSPDGSRIAFDGGPDIWTVSPDGTQLNKLTSACPDGSCPDAFFSGPSWSPDSQKLTYGSFGGLVIANADGSSPIRVNVPQVFNGPKRWSPDGSRILFGAAQQGELPWPSIFVVDRAGANVQQVTHGENAGSAFWLTAN